MNLGINCSLAIVAAAALACAAGEVPTSAEVGGRAGTSDPVTYGDSSTGGSYHPSGTGGAGPGLADAMAHDNRGGTSSRPSSLTGGGPASSGDAGKVTTTPDGGESSRTDGASKLSFLTTVSQCGGFRGTEKLEPYTWYRGQNRPLEWASEQLYDAGTADSGLPYCDAELLEWSCDSKTGLTLRVTRQLNNCCGSLNATLEPEDDAYRMKVVAVDGYCDCECVFDVEVTAPTVSCESKDLLLDLPRSGTPARTTLPLAEKEGQVVLSTEPTHGICRSE